MVVSKSVCHRTLADVASEPPLSPPKWICMKVGSDVSFGCFINCAEQRHQTVSTNRNCVLGRVKLWCCPLVYVVIALGTGVTWQMAAYLRKQASLLIVEMTRKMIENATPHFFYTLQYLCAWWFSPVSNTCCVFPKHSFILIDYLMLLKQSWSHSVSSIQ